MSMDSGGLDIYFDCRVTFSWHLSSIDHHHMCLLFRLSQIVYVYAVIVDRDIYTE